MPFIAFMGYMVALPSTVSQEKSFRPPIVICCLVLEGAETDISFEEENTPWHTQGGQLAASDADREFFPAAHRKLLFDSCGS
jgi:hypothetical protein